jgi:hypothetical protein
MTLVHDLSIARFDASNLWSLLRLLDVAAVGPESGSKAYMEDTVLGLLGGEAVGRMLELRMKHACL